MIKYIIKYKKYKQEQRKKVDKCFSKFSIHSLYHTRGREIRKYEKSIMMMRKTEGQNKTKIILWHKKKVENSA